ncbi:response regulator [Caballeronia sp. dw_276]|uniref:response regulator transcription factor n=1 Tax=Caballeronia sp. dw_276 TaxID=2719795 RepID=UPI001BD5EFBE|nr:response regulator [Caballeronia sp. dw_276]
MSNGFVILPPVKPSPPPDRRDAIVYVVDDEAPVRRALATLMRSVDMHVETFSSTEEFLHFARPAVPSCLLLDVRLRNKNGLAFQQEIVQSGLGIPVLFMTGHGDIEMSVKAMKSGAMDFFAKPFRDQDMLDAIGQALARDATRLASENVAAGLRASYGTLSPREKEVLPFVLAGLLNKQIASEMNLSEITVKVHRGQVMRKLNARSLPDLVRKAEALGIEPHESRDSQVLRGGTGDARR